MMDKAPYYADKPDVLSRLFGGHVADAHDHIAVGDRRYEIVDDVILLIPPDASGVDGIAARTRASFGAEWTEYLEILPEHRREFEAYVDIVDLRTLRDAVVCDLGCGMGRWSFFLKEHSRALVLVDFSEAIFSARRNLAGSNACFFMGDLTRLPFADDFCDFLICLGVLHHLPRPCLEEVRRLRRAAPRLLIYLYYALDNRPRYFQALLALVTAARRALSRVRSPRFRRGFSFVVARLVYRPLIGLGKLLRALGRETPIPLFDYYAPLGNARIEQDVYDRFFTPIEQRVSRAEIAALADSFREVRVSPGLPFWHFLCER
jgi:SAM-dependent methyltransferase